MGAAASVASENAPTVKLQQEAEIKAQLELIYVRGTVCNVCFDLAEREWNLHSTWGFTHEICFRAAFLQLSGAFLDFLKLFFTGSKSQG